ncbi:MAG: gamma-glutamyl-gamma-aminobutyrate hydrolase family protein [Oxalobacteraceae bacterium]|nr:gamma-glutamyl-gamma-aminobutyrate hydrolase family protein [Oxalobacteraceae bacterium]
MRSPIVVVPSCTRSVGAHPYYVAQVKYVDAVLTGAGCQPLVLPAMGARIDWEAVLEVADGVMLTGSPSNVHPSHFEQTVLNPALPLDPARDATTLPLIRAAIERGIPLFAICRGAQEINVALGGSLHQALHQAPGFIDHREPEGELEAQYMPAHMVTLTPGGMLMQILGVGSQMMVNSLHGQGIDRLASGLVVEARAQDGLIEAYRIDAPGFSLALQWHPEWRLADNPDGLKLYAAFGRACRLYQSQKSSSAATLMQPTEEGAYVITR